MIVNRRLLPLKAYYFFNYGAAGSLLPLIMVHLKYLGMTTLEAGFINGVTQICSFLFRPFVGALADKYSRYKTLLLLTLLLFGCGYFSFMFIPARSQSKHNHHVSACDVNLSQKFNSTNYELNKTTKVILQKNITNCDYTLINVNNGTTPDLGTSWTVDWTAGITFGMFFIAKVSYSCHQTILDTITYFIIHPKRHLYSKQRLWGTVGTLISVSSIVYVVDIYYNGIFYVFLGFTLLTFLVGLPIEVNVANESNVRFYSTLKNQMCSVHLMFFYLKILYFGMCLGSMMNFLFWYLKDIGIHESFLAIIILINCVSSVCVHQFTPKLLKLCGPDVCINFGLGAYVLRFVGHSFINSKWYIIPLELLHGVTYSLLWSSISSKVNLISPTGSHGTFQGITGAIYNDLGRGFGAILTGSLFQIYDARWVWRSYSASCLILLIIFNITDRVWPMQESYSTKGEVVKDSEATENMLERPTVVKHGELTTNSETL